MLVFSANGLCVPCIYLLAEDISRITIKQNLIRERIKFILVPRLNSRREASMSAPRLKQTFIPFRLSALCQERTLRAYGKKG